MTGTTDRRPAMRTGAGRSRSLRRFGSVVVAAVVLGAGSACAQTGAPKPSVTVGAPYAGTALDPPPTPRTVAPRTSAPAATTATAQTTAPAPACPAAGVVIRTENPEAAMGLRVIHVAMVNCGTQPYSVNGYPSVRVLDEDRSPLDVRVGRGASSIADIDNFDAGAQPVTLQPGERAVAALAWRNTVTGINAAPANGAYLDIAPAEGRPHQIVKPEGGRIDLGTTGKLGVSAWQASPTR
ncbi:DUF4232 domain-containing protein [Streptomyces sp. SID3343]|uniref:DUF4232 domain-containing protein n=1 Tax=Streptomyces sp. SID3343 TaxID=2690260 RepID=UPI00136FFAA6|nr:DUF4232 domain-containing protein [Streptomyces sp. SID3343]MYW06101.1 DUF4232 domain-containing protein [Streptomyces sp. SID3343]